MTASRSCLEMTAVTVPPTVELPSWMRASEADSTEAMV